MDNENDLILNFPREIKIATLEDALRENKFDIFIGLSKIFLDAPINAGGLETELIESIHERYLKGQL